MAIVSHSSPPVSNPQPTFVYFISAGATPIKIGVSYDPIQRLAELQTAHYQKLSLLYAIECKERSQALELESAFHRWYDDVRIRNEWFNLNPKRIADDIRLLTKLANLVISAVQYIATPDLEIMEARAEERISRRLAATDYSRTADGQGRRVLDHLAANRADAMLSSRVLAKKIEEQTGAPIGHDTVAKALRSWRTTIHTDTDGAS